MSRIKIIISESAEKIYETEVDVQVKYINYGNHLGHDSLISILQEARLRFIKDNRMISEVHIDGNIGCMVSSLSINYLAEAFHGDKLQIQIYVTDITAKSCDLSYKVTKSNKNTPQIIATAITCLFFCDFNSKKIVDIPKIFLSAITSKDKKK